MIAWRELTFIDPTSCASTFPQIISPKPYSPLVRVPPSNKQAIQQQLLWREALRCCLFTLQSPEEVFLSTIGSDSIAQK